MHHASEKWIPWPIFYSIHQEHDLQSVDAILEDVFVAETIV